mmetsp:Transcript_9222/g.27295  ORF Transcript_9222/g.27295 Transcript_9222/m.27295 type:complete len:412 (+) Transcript_9222:66-1301(+)
MAPGATAVAAATLLAAALGQFLPPGTTDVPSPRPGDCNGKGPASYVYRLSAQKPNDYFPEACPGLGGATVRFNDPCAWAHGQAQMTMAHFNSMCKGATRTIHWHNGADEWGFVLRGQLQTFVASPDGLPWPSSNNILSPKGVWYFPSGWLHGLMCVTPESEGGCEFYIVFASPQAAEPNGHNLDTTLAQAPAHVAARALKLQARQFVTMRPAFSISANASSVHSPIVTMVAPGACEPTCPPVQETVGAPAAMAGDAVEQTVRLEGAEGLTLHQIRTQQFPFSRTMSQERAELQPGALRPMAWATADGLLCVLSGSITISLEGGILGREAHLSFTNETLVAGDVAYLPNGRAFWFNEATGKAAAETITVFNVGIWKNIEFEQSLKLMPAIAVLSNLHVDQIPGSSASAPVHV